MMTTVGTMTATAMPPIKPGRMLLSEEETLLVEALEGEAVAEGVALEEAESSFVGLKGLVVTSNISGDGAGLTSSRPFKSHFQPLSTGMIPWPLL